MRDIWFIFFTVSYFGSCQQPLHPAKLAPNAPVCVQLPGAGGQGWGGGGPKQTDPPKATRKLWAEPSEGTKQEGTWSAPEVSLVPHMLVGILNSSCQQRGPGYRDFLWEERSRTNSLQKGHCNSCWLCFYWALILELFCPCCEEVLEIWNNVTIIPSPSLLKRKF